MTAVLETTLSAPAAPALQIRSAAQKSLCTVMNKGFRERAKTALAVLPGLARKWALSVLRSTRNADESGDLSGNIRNSRCRWAFKRQERAATASDTTQQDSSYAPCPYFCEGCDANRNNGYLMV